MEIIVSYTQHTALYCTCMVHAARLITSALSITGHRRHISSLFTPPPSQPSSTPLSFSIRWPHVSANPVG